MKDGTFSIIFFYFDVGIRINTKENHSQTKYSPLKSQTGKQQILHLQNFKKYSSQLYQYLRIQKQECNILDPDEVPYQPPHLDLHCLQIELFSFLEISVLNLNSTLKDQEMV